jgi:hypothetical protein
MGVNSYFLRDSSQAALPTSSTQILPFSSARSFLLLENTDATNDIWVNLTGGTAVARGPGCIFLPHASATQPSPSRIVFNAGCPTNAITAISLVATTSLTVIDNGVA